MREIKFRAWNKKSKKMITNITLRGLVVNYCDEFNYPARLEEGLNQGLIDDGAIFMQYTGLKDKNGKEIYEGDIVKFGKNMYSPFENSIAEVEWFEANLKYILKKKHIKKDDKDPLVLDIEDLGNASGGVGEMPEIIGNIYENPEMLNK